MIFIPSIFRMGWFGLHDTNKIEIDFLVNPIGHCRFIRFCNCHCLFIASFDFCNFFGVRQMIVRSTGQRFQYTVEQYTACTASFFNIFFRIVVTSPIVSFAPFAMTIVHEIVYHQTCCGPWCFNKFQFIIYWIRERRKEKKKEKNETIVYILINLCEFDWMDLMFDPANIQLKQIQHFWWWFQLIKLVFILYIAFNYKNYKSIITV